MDVTLVEGAVSSEEDLERSGTVRAHTKLLVSLGDCAVTANVPVDAKSVRGGVRCSIGLRRERELNQRTPLQVDSPASAACAPCTRSREGGCLCARMSAARTDSLRAVRTACRTTPEVADALWRLGEQDADRSLSIPLLASKAMPRSRSSWTNGIVQDARFHVTQFRGFEKLCEGRPFYEMPSLMARICGICPCRHLIASAKACDALLAVASPKPPKASPHHAPCPDRAVACAELLPSLVSGLLAGDGF